MSLYVAEHFRGLDIVAVSNSSTQKRYIDAKAKSIGLTNLTVYTQDAARLDLPAASFDRIISVEMLEHMKNYEQLFGKLSGFLRPGGMTFFHIFTSNT